MAKFQTMTSGEKSKIERGKFFTNKTEMINLTNYSEVTKKILYSYLSDFTHNGYLSLLQIEQNDNPTKQQTMLLAGLIHLAIIMSLTTLDLANKFPIIQALLDKNPTS